ncbi:MAG: RICIN domain-containing protein, partial [Oscillospiraceae bacterium]
GYTSNVYIDCYELDGTQKWRIDLGKNIRAGAHYTQFIAYDFDGDGKAEIAMKTADGTVAGDGTVIGDSSKDYRNSSGYILSGPEYLTMFEGETGKILQTVDYYPARGTVSSWGDSYGNRVDRFLAGVAYLDGKTPSLIMCRGYYTRAVIVAYQFKNGSLTRQWIFDSNDSGNSDYAGQGNHSISIADVDDDGFDEIVYGSAVIDHNGQGLYSTKQGHGDAIHVGDFDPDHSGLEIYQVHETKSSSIESVQMRDAKSGSTLWAVKTGTDVGRGLIANIGPDYYPYVAMASTGNYDKNGNKLDLDLGKFGINFSIWWDGDLYREGLDRTYINKWNYNTKSIDRLLTGSNVHSNNSTKATPSLSADILGDWREEVIWPTSDDTALRIYISTDVTEHKLYTFMHDIQYREAIAWQNVAYNQPPHPSFYVGEDMPTPTQPDVYTVGSYTEKQLDVQPKTGANIKEGKYMIKSELSGMYLDVTGGAAANGTNVQMWGASGPASYNTWKLKSVGDGYYQIYSCVGDGSYLLDLDYGKTDNGTNIQIYQNTYCDAQLFKFVEVSSGKYVIATKATTDQSNLDIYNHDTGSGANVCQWEYTGLPNQIWTLEEVADESSSKAESSSTADSSSSKADSSSTVTSDVIYCSPSGTGSGASKDDPADVSSAISSIKAGGTIYLLGGTYSFDKTLVINESNSGTSSAFKTISAYPGEKVVWDFSNLGTSDSNRGVVMDGSYWHWYGFTIANAGDNGMLLSGDNNKIEMMVFEGNQDTGLQLSRYNSSYSDISQWPQNNLILNCTSRNNCDDATMENADGFAAKLTCGEGNVFDGCMAYNNSDDGYDLYAKTDAGAIGTVTIKNCLAFRNGYTESGKGYGDCDGNGFKLGGSGVGSPHIVTNCLAFENLNCGFTDNNNPDLAKISDCTAVNNGIGNNSKPNFSVYRCTNCDFDNLMTYYNNSDIEKASDKFVGTYCNGVYYNTAGYYKVTSDTAVTNGEKIGTKFDGPTDSDFISTTAGAMGTDFHTVWRNSDGGINTQGYFQTKENGTYSSMGYELSSVSEDSS